MPLPNGYFIQFLAWAAGCLLTGVVALIGVILRQHQKSDEDHRIRIDKEIEKLRDRFHKISNQVSETNTRLRWSEEDKTDNRRK